MSIKFNSRRSPFLCRNGCVATSQNLASTIGLNILQNNGNAIDASIAIAAALSVLEPCSTGLGGDMFALVYLANEREVHAINGSGRCGSNVSIDAIKERYGDDGLEEKFIFSPFSVTVPGAARGWEDLYQKYGSGNISFEQLLEPAAKLAADGFPIGPITAEAWGNEMHKIYKYSPKDTHDIPLSIKGQAPKVGQIMYNKDLANVLRSLGKHGASNGFYNSFVGANIIQRLKELNNDKEILTHDDMINHKSTFPTPIHKTYHNVRLYQVPPNGQGIAALIALKGLEYLEEHGKCNKEKDVGSVEYLHSLIEMMHLGFDDATSHITDLDYDKTASSLEWLLDEERIARRALATFDVTKAVAAEKCTRPSDSSCTVSFQVVDGEGNAVSFVQSNYMGFGTGIVPKSCGFTLHNRGYGFSLDKTHPNALKPHKRPYHTIIPGMLTYKDTNEFYASISNMGAFMQPQGHLQLTVAMVTTGLDPQSIIDLPRFRISGGGCGNAMECSIDLEDGFDEKVVEKLREMGHVFTTHNDDGNDTYLVKGFKRSMFGRAQIIKRDRDSGILMAGSDGRADGCAIGY